jgi:hypothetical protein
VSHIAQKVFYPVSWNFSGMLISMCSCTPGYFRVDLLSIFRVIALVLVKKVFDTGSLNFTGVLMSMWRCAPGVSFVDLSSICRVIALDLVKTVSLCCVICYLSAWVRIYQLNWNNDQPHCEAMHLGFCMWIFFSFGRVIALDSL